MNKELRSFPIRRSIRTGPSASSHSCACQKEEMEGTINKFIMSSSYLDLEHADVKMGNNVHVS